MLNNFIYAKKKVAFERALDKGEVLDESVVFIEDTKEIWNHGTYFDCSKISLDDYAKLSDIPSAVTESIVAGWGFTKNEGTVTGITVNGVSKGTSGVVDLGTIITEHQDISGKQDKLVSGTNIKTINGTSILGSGNITIEGGTSGSSGNGAYAEVNHGTSDTTFILTPNTFHVWDTVSNLTITLGEETSGIANEYLFQFNSGTEPTTLILPDDIKWLNDTPPTIAENMIYQVSILKGLASVLEFDNKPKLTTISFKIQNLECIAEEGMTWEQWVPSEYNTINCRVIANNVYYYAEVVATSDNIPVRNTDIIISNFDYLTLSTTE